MGAFGFCAQTAGCNPATVNPLASNYTCGGAACAFYVVENGPYASGARRSDVLRIRDHRRIPSERQSRHQRGRPLGQLQFHRGEHNGTAARAFWVNAFNQDTCYNTQN